MPATNTNAFRGGATLLQPGMWEQIRLTWRLLRDERVAPWKYVLPALLTLYVASPIDPIPDFLLGIGQSDDLGVAIALVVLMTRLIPRIAPAAVVDEHLRDLGGYTANDQAKAKEDIFDAQFNVR
jgi:uncharacterized membrane protein YkvA (DUF1232 family)